MDFSPDLSKSRIDPMRGPALAIYALSIVMGSLSFLVVGMRMLLRLRSGGIGWDDWFMAAGMAVYVAEIVMSCLGARAGLGTRNPELSPAMHTDAIMYLMLWMLLYISSLLLIKTSICITMLRIAGGVRRLFRVFVWANLGIIVATFITTFTGVLLLCSPVEANWNSQLIIDGKGKCASMDAMIGLSYTSTGATIATDIACAVLPGLILWRTQIETRTKWAVMILLSFGSFASICTMIRTPYIAYYRNPTQDLPYYTGHIVLWSNIETAIGLICGSLPSLRTFLVGIFKSGGTGYGSNKQQTPPNADLVTFGSMPVNGSRDRKKGGWGNPTETGVSTATVMATTWERLSESSDRPVAGGANGITKQTAIEMDWESQGGKGSTVELNSFK